MSTFSIYQIVSAKTNKVYFGSTQQTPADRWSDHDAMFRHNRHSNKHLQSLYNSGITDWKMEVLTTANTKDNARALEKELAIGNSNSINVIYIEKHGALAAAVNDRIIEAVYKAKIAGTKQYLISKMVGLSDCTISYIIQGAYAHTKGMQLAKFITEEGKKNYSLLVA